VIVEIVIFLPDGSTPAAAIHRAGIDNADNDANLNQLGADSQFLPANRPFCAATRPVVRFLLEFRVEIRHFLTFIQAV
jgi:hypothetical protein